MMDCMAITTPMASNLKLLSDASSVTVDAMMYRQLICSLMYLTDMRPNTCFAVNTLRHVHLMAAKGTIDYGLKYEVNQKINLEGYVDSDWLGSSIDRKITSGCCFSMGSCVISWFNRNRSYVVVMFPTL